MNTDGMEFIRGRRALQDLLEEPCDVRSVDLAGFRRWLSERLRRWKRDPVFRQRSRIRDLRRGHPALVELERRVRRARRAEEAHPLSAGLSSLEGRISDYEKAVAGLTAAGNREAKLRAFEERLAAARADLEEVESALPARLERRRLEAELADRRESSGLAREEETLRSLQLAVGQRSARSGRSFEERALEATRELIGGRVLTAVTLGAARLELDQLVVRGRHPAVVLALVEAKRNLDDLGHGFRQRQENLAWLCGDRSSYDPSDYRTRTFPTGHFDRPVEHEDVLLAPESFRLFRREAGWFLGRLWFVSRPSRPSGLSSRALSRVAHRVSTDLDWAPRHRRYLQALHEWCRSLAAEVETPDVLRLYAAEARRARQIVLLG